MRYSLETTYRRYVKGYDFLLFARKFGDKYGKKLMDTATKTGINTAKKFGYKYGKNLMDTKKIIEKSTKATGDLIGNKIADKLLH